MNRRFLRSLLGVLARADAHHASVAHSSGPHSMRAGFECQQQAREDRVTLREVEAVPHYG